ncbi:helix-turn-helix transcriptional regulator [Fenollaria sporofastidiosus]|uniref:helix-turn-helix transcriptional regulator n=1 Tax=Fenollaria sporofastidiosus TaxID=2811778 RepID=UPI001C0016BF|nr:response regulator transcription factor [Fenollaria sporofastidiosus]
MALKSYRVLIVGGSHIYALGLRASLSLFSDMHVVESFREASLAQDYLTKKSVDFVIYVDDELDESKRITDLQEIAVKNRRYRILLMTNKPSLEMIISPKDFHLDGIMDKELTRDALHDALLAMRKGDVLVSKEKNFSIKTEQKLGDFLDHKDLYDTLSPREKQILLCIKDGLSNKEIAERFYITVSTTKTHARNIYRKLGVKSRSQAIKFLN